jgi:hypothetical protein
LPVAKGREGWLLLSPAGTGSRWPPRRVASRRRPPVLSPRRGRHLPASACGCVACRTVLGVDACMLAPNERSLLLAVGRPPAGTPLLLLAPAEAVNDPALLHASPLPALLVNKTRLRNALCARHNHVTGAGRTGALDNARFMPPPHPARPQVLAVRVFFILLTTR